MRTAACSDGDIATCFSVDEYLSPDLSERKAGDSEGDTNGNITSTKKNRSAAEQSGTK